MMSIVQGENGYKEVKLEDQHLASPETMVPLIVWETDKKTGGKSYYCGKLDQLPPEALLYIGSLKEAKLI